MSPYQCSGGIMTASLELKNIIKKYGEKPVINDLSFEAAPGEFIVLVGPSGCGKSTMLRSIAGLESISSGKMLIDGKDVANLPPKDRDIAMVFQDYALYPHMTVFENIAFGLKIRKVNKDTIENTVKEVAEKLDLAPYLTRKPAELSGGQRQRVAIGRAIVRNPKVFLFDEPLSNLDAKLRGTMRQTISQLHHELSATIVYVTHDQVEAMTLADRIIVLEGGKIQQIGSPLDLYYHPSNKFVATFIGSPPMAMIDGTLNLEGEQISFISDKGLKFTIPEKHQSEVKASGSHGQKVTWGLRCENLGITPEGKEKHYEGTVLLTEPLGNVTNVLFDIEGHEVTVALSGPLRPSRGDKLPLSFKSTHLYLFDQSSSLALLK